MLSLMKVLRKLQRDVRERCEPRTVLPSSRFCTLSTASWLWKIAFGDFEEEFQYILEIEYKKNGVKRNNKLEKIEQSCDNLETRKKIQ